MHMRPEGFTVLCGEGASQSMHLCLCAFWSGTLSHPQIQYALVHIMEQAVLEHMNWIPFWTENSKTRCASRGHWWDQCCINGREPVMNGTRLVQSKTNLDSVY